MSVSQRVMRWQPIIEELWPNIKHITGVDNIVYDTLIRLPYTPSDKYELCTRMVKCHANKLFSFGRDKTAITVFRKIS